MSRAFSFTPFDDTQSSSSSASASASSPQRPDEMNINLDASSDPVYRTMYTPLSPSNSASLELSPDAPVYRGMTLDYEHLSSEPSFAWHDLAAAQPAKELSLPSLSSFDSSSSSSSSSAFSHKLSSLPDIQVVESVSTRPLSPLPAQFDRQFSFLSSSSSTALLAFLTSAFSSPSFPLSTRSSLHPRYPSLSVSAQQSPRTVTVAINLFSSSSTSSSSSPVVVEFQRRSGDLALFHSLFVSTVELLQSAGHFMAPCTAALSLSPMSPMSPPSFSRASTATVGSPSLSVSSAPPSMDDSDDELDLVAMSLYKDQALRAENHHNKRDALYAVYQSAAPSLVQGVEVEMLFVSACQAADVQERELSMQLLADKVLPSLSLDSAVFARSTPLLCSALSASSSSVWWQRAATQALLICSNAQSAKVDKLAVEKLLIDCEDEEVVKHLEEVLDTLKQ